MLRLLKLLTTNVVFYDINELKKKQFFTFVEEKQYKTMMHTASCEVERYRKETRSSLTALGRVSKELKSCSLTQEKFFF